MDTYLKELYKSLDYEIFKTFEQVIQKADITRENQDKLYEALNNKIEEIHEIVWEFNFEIKSDIEKYETEYSDYKDYLWAKYHVVV